MKRFIIILVMIAIVGSLKAQDEAFENLAKLKGTDVVHISSSMLKLMPDIKTQGVDVGSIAGKLNSITIISADRESSVKNVRNEIDNIVKKGSYEQTMFMKDNGSKTVFYIRKINNNSSELLMLSDEAKEINLIRIVGNISAKDLQKLTSGKDRGKDRKEAEEQRRKAREARERAREEVQKAKEEARKAREQAREEADRARSQAHVNAEQARKEAQKAREEALKAREEALKEREKALKEAEKLREEAQKMREQMLREAEKNREKSMREAQKLRKQTQTQVEEMRKQLEDARKEMNKAPDIMMIPDIEFPEISEFSMDFLY
ncbi:DUF4252 domain-containing protein [Dysgonomonas sp. 216]|uniref:DUF4252 domain-containing protein n=1 Tax=Dysgonomonas sp. 216 TaxID=2302934 RepID=UPI0013D8CB74|nr:DUF4252 domain-containing protein [Dysgonomonas sp. 216]NDW18372.1 DUF4252 domain-containing protein [Dysgonomonas sp. 216]